MVRQNCTLTQMNSSDKTSRVYTMIHIDFSIARLIKVHSVVLLIGEVRIDNRVEAFVLPFHMIYFYI